MTNSRDLDGRTLAPETLMMSLGYDPERSEGAIKPPLFQSSTFAFRNAAEGKRFFEVAYGLRSKGPDEVLGLIYSRINNPNLEILEERLAVWESAQRALVFGSGMAAISSTVLALCRPGETIAYTAPGYGGAEYLFKRILPRLGIETVPLYIGRDRADLRSALERLFDEVRCGRRTVSMVYAETPANPTNELVDLADLAGMVSTWPGRRPVVVVDNTFLGPVWQQPLRVGADVSLYSLTKYVGGHSDLVAGAVLGAGELLARIAEIRTMCGTTTDPHTAWLLLRSLETLHVRMRASAESARMVAAALERHPAVCEVLFPEAASRGAEQRDIYRRQCSGPGSTFSFRIRGGQSEAFRVLDSLRLFRIAVSLGGTESLASHPATMTHCDYDPVSKRRFGIGDELIRLSIGLENPGDLIADLDAALARASVPAVVRAGP